MAAPLGPPPHSATTSILPSGVTRLSVPRLISTASTDPSGMATGPSGNSRPDAMTRTFSMSGEHMARSPALRHVPLDGGVDAAPHQPVRLHGEPAWCDGGDEVVGDAVGDVLVEGALLPVAPQVQLQRLELDDGLAGHIADDHRGEVRLTGHGADAGELRRLAPHLVVPRGMGVGDRDQVFGGRRGHAFLLRSFPTS